MGGDGEFPGREPAEVDGVAGIAPDRWQDPDGRFHPTGDNERHASAPASHIEHCAGHV